MEKWWNTYIFRTGPGKEISETEFIQCLSDSRKKDKGAFTKEMQACFDTIFDVIDTNKDRKIELDEFIYVFRAFGHENEDSVTKFFQKCNAPEGVPIRDIVSAYVKFVTSDNSADKDIVYESLKTVV